MTEVRKLLSRIRREMKRRATTVVTESMGRKRIFAAYDAGHDTFILEQGVWQHLDMRPSVLIVAKRDLGLRASGYVMAVSSGNHAVSAFPLLDGRFWSLSRVRPNRRSEVLRNHILCANIVDDVIETSQRDVSCAELLAADRWLTGDLGLPLDVVVMGDRNEQTLEYYRALGQEWRVKPLAWTENEMKTALAASCKRIATRINYYHSARGVHFLTFSEFERLVARSETDMPEFVRGLKEIVAVFEGNLTSFARTLKYRGHHEIELFGIRRGASLQSLVPELELLMESIELGREGRAAIIRRAHALVELYRSLLERPEFADETSEALISALYMYVTGEVYAVVGEGTTPAFDDRRTALPGATFVEGRPVMHPGADRRTEMLLSNLRGFMSKDEQVEYANVYELRTSHESCELGLGATRELVYKTNCRPLEHGLIEKRLSSVRKGYSSYVLVRVGALRALGISLSGWYQLLKRRPGRKSCAYDYYLRERCEGEPLDAIPAGYFRSEFDASVEDPEVVLALAGLMGDAAAQNLAMKKYDGKRHTPHFGVGKEIYEFGYDIARRRIFPQRVRTCSIRGSFGWPNLAHDEKNLTAVFEFYLAAYARALHAYAAAHTVDIPALVERFLDGFAFRTKALDWQMSVMRDKFEAFAPDVPSYYDFTRKWRFALWSLAEQQRQLPRLRDIFLEKWRQVK